MNLFSEQEKAALWDLLESRRISVTPIGFDSASGFRATLWTDAEDDCIDTREAIGPTAKDAVEKVIAHEIS